MVKEAASQCCSSSNPMATILFGFSRARLFKSIATGVAVYFTFVAFAQLPLLLMLTLRNR